MERQLASRQNTQCNFLADATRRGPASRKGTKNGGAGGLPLCFVELTRPKTQYYNSSLARNHDDDGAVHDDWLGPPPPFTNEQLGERGWHPFQLRYRAYDSKIGGNKIDRRTGLDVDEHFLGPDEANTDWVRMEERQAVSSAVVRTTSQHNVPAGLQGAARGADNWYDHFEVDVDFGKRVEEEVQKGRRSTKSSSSTEVSWDDVDLSPVSSYCTGSSPEIITGCPENNIANVGTTFAEKLKSCRQGLHFDKFHSPAYDFHRKIVAVPAILPGFPLLKPPGTPRNTAGTGDPLSFTLRAQQAMDSFLHAFPRAGDGGVGERRPHMGATTFAGLSHEEAAVRLHKILLEEATLNSKASPHNGLLFFCSRFRSTEKTIRDQKLHRLGKGADSSNFYVENAENRGLTPSCVLAENATAVAALNSPVGQNFAALLSMIFANDCHPLSIRWDARRNEVMGIKVGSCSQPLPACFKVQDIQKINEVGPHDLAFFVGKKRIACLCVYGPRPPVSLSAAANFITSSSVLHQHHNHRHFPLPLHQSHNEVEDGQTSA